MSKTSTIDLEDPEALAAHSRRSFLTRGAAGAAVAVAGGAALTALAASPAAAAAADVVLITPTRIYDSRPGQPQSGAGDGLGTIFTRGNAARRVFFGTESPAVDIVPDDATGVFINIAITNTVSTGALGFTAGSVATPPTASAINWFGPSQILANMLLIPADSVATGGKSNANLATVQAHVIAGTAGVSATHFIVDCFGYVAGS